MPNHQCPTVHEVAAESPWVEWRVSGHRTYRIRISHVRTIAPTLDELRAQYRRRAQPIGRPAAALPA